MAILDIFNESMSTHKGARLAFSQRQDIKTRRLQRSTRWTAGLIAPQTAVMMTFSGVFSTADRSHLDHVLSAPWHSQGHMSVVITAIIEMLMEAVTYPGTLSIQMSSIKGSLHVT